MQKVLFARIGWMTYYKDLQAGDERVYGGGKYNKSHIGNEYRNFMPLSAKVYGAFANQMRAAELNISRIDPTTSGHSAADVLLIFFARHRYDSSLGQVIVGWHRNATVFSQRHRSPWSHYSEAPSAKAVLLPTNRRTFVIPHGSSKLVAPGRANVFFLLDTDGKRRQLAWIDQVLEYINSYQGPNLLVDRGAELDSSFEDTLESGIASAYAQGFQSNPRIRRAVELRAMESAKRYFRKRHFTVNDHSKTHPYDLLCSKRNQVFYVEVKGSQNPISQVILTRNEATFLRKRNHQSALYLLHSIKLRKRRNRFIANGGIAQVINPWRIEGHRLKPTHFLYPI